jgi:hypothetical protein
MNDEIVILKDTAILDLAMERDQFRDAYAQ